MRRTFSATFFCVALLLAFPTSWSFVDAFGIRLPRGNHAETYSNLGTSPGTPPSSPTSANLNLRTEQGGIGSGSGSFISPDHAPHVPAEARRYLRDASVADQFAEHHWRQLREIQAERHLAEREARRARAFTSFHGFPPDSYAERHRRYAERRRRPTRAPVRPSSRDSASSDALRERRRLVVRNMVGFRRLASDNRAYAESLVRQHSGASSQEQHASARATLESSRQSMRDLLLMTDRRARRSGFDETREDRLPHRAELQRLLAPSPPRQPTSTLEPPATP